MRLNTRVRKRLVRDLDDGEEILATIAMNYTVGGGWASSGGTVHQGGSIYSGDYATRLGIDFDDPTLRADLVSSWCTLTDERIVFHRPSNTSIRPTPGKLADVVPRDGVELRYFDSSGLSMTSRAIHLLFPDDTHVLSATMLKASLRRRPYNDEPDLFVRAFGDAATAVDDA